MDLAWQIKLIDEMIQENPDYTIRDYLNLCAELETIDNKTNDMNGLPVTEEEKDRIVEAVKEKTPMLICKDFNRAPSTVYGVLKERGYDVKSEKDKRVDEQWVKDQLTHIARLRGQKERKPRPAKQILSPLVRAKAEYSNTGFISVTQKYGS